jgi:AraC-like DNA-binding protein
MDHKPVNLEDSLKRSRQGDDMAIDDFNTRISILPGPTAARALAAPLTRRLLVVVASTGSDHYLDRPEGAPYAIVQPCVAGEGWVRIDGVTHKVDRGRAFVIPAHVPNAYGPTTKPWTTWGCALVGTDVPDFIRAMGVDRSRPVVAVKDLERVIALMDEIVSCYEANISPANILQASGAAWRLLTQLTVDRFSPTRGDPLARAMTYIEERLDARLSLPELAAVVGLSTSHLGALFRESTGGGALAYQTGLRMAKARRLLDSTTWSVSEISRAVGYRDPYHFSRSFHRLHGMSPREFRNRHA